MKNSINTILLIIIIILLGCLIWLTLRKQSATPATENQEAKIQLAAERIRAEHGTGFPIQKCSYNGETVLKLDTRPVDGPVTLFDLDAKTIGSASSGFGGPVQSTIDFSQVINCSNI